MFMYMYIIDYGNMRTFDIHSIVVCKTPISKKTDKSVSVMLGPHYHDSWHDRNRGLNRGILMVIVSNLT